LFYAIYNQFSSSTSELVSITPKMQIDISGAGHRERLRARFFQAGLGAFSSHEKIELLLTLALSRGDVKPLAKSLLAKYGSCREILHADADDLLSVPGVGSATVFALHFFRALIPEYLAEEMTMNPASNQSESLSGRLSDLWRSRLGHRKNEVFEVALLSPSYALIGVITHSQGSVDQTAVHPSEIIRSALKADAYALAFAHNHPSGDPTPSDADKLLTRQLVLAATATRIKVVDHLIVTSNACFSFRKEGLL
jgi:DNA repair protein RadC